MSKSQKAFIWIFGSSPKITNNTTLSSNSSHPSVIPAPYRGTGQAPAVIQSSDSNTVKAQRAFTLIELLITISILAILGSAISIVLNPAELLAEARDSQRINDLESLRNSLSLTLIDNPSLFDSLSNTSIYLSLPSSSCLTNPPSGYTYICNATSLNLQKTDSTGWLPLSLTNLPVFPIDPVNSSSSSLYYAFVPDSTNKTFVLTSLLESEKYLKLSALKDGGTDPGRIEEGNPTLWTAASGLVGYWPMDEGTGTTAQDLSGNGNTGTWNGTGTHYNAGKVGSYAGEMHPATSDYILVLASPSVNNLSAFTVVGWMKPSIWHHVTTLIDKGPEIAAQHFWVGWWGGGNNRMAIELGDSSGYLTNYGSAGLTWNNNDWYFVGATLDDAVKTYKHFYNGQLAGSGTYSSGRSFNSGTYNISIGTYSSAQHNVDGLIDDLRIYNRVLSTAEIQAIYTAQQ